MGRNGFFASHSKSSAMVVSLVLHAVLVLLAFFFVAVTVTQKKEVDFEAKAVSRPKMNLRKLQVPVNIKKQAQQPKLRRQIVAAPKLSKVSPDIKMPEIVGVKGGLGGGAGGLGSAVSLGFTMPQIDMFGVKGKGEKIFIILDASPEMMVDEIGGIPAYTLIKQEVLNIVGQLPPTSLFNISVYESWRTFMLFPELAAASPSNVEKAEKWLEPLNSVRPGMGADEYGASTLGPGGKEYTDDFRTGKFERQELWHRSAMLAMKQQADTVFLLTAFWGHQRIDSDKPWEKWMKTAAGKKWQECYEEAKRLLDEENRQRIANGQPPRVLRRENAWVMNRAYFPDIEFPPEPEYYYHSPLEFVESFALVREKYKSTHAGLGIKKDKRKINFAFNVIHFRKLNAEENHWYDGRTEENFRKLVSLCGSEYRSLAGLSAIESSMAE